MASRRICLGRRPPPSPTRPGGPDMSMGGPAVTRESWPRSRIMTAVLAVSLVLNVLFVAGAVWGRIEKAPARGLDQRFERIGAQLDLDATQRVAFDRLLAELHGRGEKVQQ